MVMVGLRETKKPVSLDDAYEPPKITFSKQTRHEKRTTEQDTYPPDIRFIRDIGQGINIAVARSMMIVITTTTHTVISDQSFLGRRSYRVVGFVPKGRHDRIDALLHCRRE
jgi:hypothetical protein